MGFAVPAVTTIGGAALSASASRSQNQAIAASQQSVRRSQNIQSQQLARRSGVQQQRIRNEAARLRGSIRIARAEAGTGIGTTHLALLRQVDIDEALNQQIISDNFQAQQDALRTQAGANVKNLQAQVQNGVLAAFAGGLGGFSTGLNITSNLQDAERLNRTIDVGPSTPRPIPNRIPTPSGTFVGGTTL